jgi:hypothetical protein
MFTFNLNSKTSEDREVKVMDETKRKAIETPETNNSMPKAKATKLAPSSSFLPQNTVHPLMGRLNNCSFPRPILLGKLDSCTVSDATQFARYLYTFNQNYLKTSKLSFMINVR